MGRPSIYYPAKVIKFILNSKFLRVTYFFVECVCYVSDINRTFVARMSSRSHN